MSKLTLNQEADLYVRNLMAEKASYDYIALRCSLSNTKAGVQSKGMAERDSIFSAHSKKTAAFIPSPLAKLVLNDPRIKIYDLLDMKNDGVVAQALDHAVDTEQERNKKLKAAKAAKACKKKIKNTEPAIACIVERCPHTHRNEDGFCGRHRDEASNPEYITAVAASVKKSNKTAPINTNDDLLRLLQKKVAAQKKNNKVLVEKIDQKINAIISKDDEDEEEVNEEEVNEEEDNSNSE